MKTSKVFLTFLISASIAMMSFSFVKATSGSSNGQQRVQANSNDSSDDSSDSTQSQNRNENEVQTQTNNPDTGDMDQEQDRTRTEEQDQDSDLDDDGQADLDYESSNSDSQARKAAFATALKNIYQLAAKLENKGQATEIQSKAKTMAQNIDEINSSYDKAQNRSGFAKFFIGPNYKELKNIQQTMEQNRLRIQELQRIMTQLENASDQYQISLEINTLLEQQIALQDNLASASRGFSLFGWIARFWNHFNL